ncbi:cyclic nucleotide-binding protein [Thalassoporum mexicanum PCC 7367]|uniref:SulP family inorganic anion transporter n=1 Tax=Thalassoporum mexicanum TaxID=3457544 RepID=UPI00029FFDF6|nr:SulP family inorganic anion transporter [Pseudanabaena sp. PCC 7367]AFY70977.1 cyclic nucleotide-binding protein [Pseudanabaena sp. PCC 7367]
MSNQPSFVQNLKGSLEILHPRRLLPNLMAGIVSSLVMLANSISFAALIFSGDLAIHFASGVQIFLITAAVVAISVASLSRFPFAIAGPDSQAATILAVVAAGVTSQLLQQGAIEAILPTVWVMISISALAASLFLYAMGKLELGYIVRYIPYPVVGGFTAGVGWLTANGAMKVMTGRAISLMELPQLFQWNIARLWLPGVVLAVIMWAVTRRFRQAILIPTLLACGTAIAYLVIWLSGTEIEVVRAQGWLLESITIDSTVPTSVLASLGQVDWQILLAQSGNLFAMLAVLAITTLLNITGLEINTQAESNVNHELKVMGIANLLSALGSGMVGILSFNRSLINYNAGATTRLAGIITGTVCAAIVFLDPGFLAYVPKFVLGSLLFYTGLRFLYDWIYDAHNKLPLSDYGLVVLIVIIVATSGFLSGVIIGILIACLLFVVKYSNIQVVKQELSGDRRFSVFERSFEHQQALSNHGSQLLVLVLQGYLFFGTSETLFSRIRSQIASLPKHKPVKFILLDFSLVNGLDSSAVFSFVKLMQFAEREEINLIFTNLNRSLQQPMRANGSIDFSSPLLQIFPDLQSGTLWCEDQILASSGLSQHNTVPLKMLLVDALRIETSITEMAAAIVEFMAYTEPVQIKAGDLLFCHGDECNGLYFIESGMVEIFKELPDGDRQSLRIQCEGTVVGEMSIYLNSRRSATVMARQDCVLRLLRKQDFYRMEIESPQLANAFHRFIVRLMSDRLAQTTTGLPD